MTSPNDDDPRSLEASETGRLEAFSDGVLAVIITIMALELKAPAGGSFTDLRGRLPALLIYILSFMIIGIYWNNHHHLLRAARRVTAGVMWANLHLLFWLSLVPVLTEWVGENYRDHAPAATYGFVGLCAAVAFTILTRAIIRADGSSSLVAEAIGRDVKGRASLAIYAAATALAFVSPWISYALFVTVAVIWFVPDRRLTDRQQALPGGGPEPQRGPGVVDGHLADRLHAASDQGRGEPVAVQVGAELASLGVADPRQPVGAGRRYRLPGRVQVLLPGDERDHRVGVGGAGRYRHSRQRQAGRRVQHRHRLSRLDLQLAAQVHLPRMHHRGRPRQHPRGPASPRCCGPGPASGASRGRGRRRGRRAARMRGPAARGLPP